MDTGRKTNLLCESHLADRPSGRELQEGGLGRTQPAEKQAEKRVIAERDHRLDHPKNRPVVPQQVVGDRNELVAPAVQEAFRVFVEPRLVPSGDPVDLQGMSNVNRTKEIYSPFSASPSCPLPRNCRP